jgi:hypothetical protein
MPKHLVLSLLLFIAVLTGCESMSESECKVADWGRVGLNDGARGEPERKLADYTEDCGKTGVVPNAQAYRQGWDVGIKRFCTAANGWQEGLLGHANKAQVCAAQPSVEAFTRYLNAGLQVHQTQERMRQNMQESNYLQKRLESAATDDERRRIRRALQDIDLDQFRLRMLVGQQQMLAP